MNPRDIVTKFYSDKRCVKPRRGEIYETRVVSIMPVAIGDTVMLTHIPYNATAVGKDIRIFSQSSYFSDMMTFNPYFKAPENGSDFMFVEQVAAFDWGGGHTLQRMQKAFGIATRLKPKGLIDGLPFQKKGRIGFHLTTGASAWTPNHPHSQPRQIYEENIKVLLEFIGENPQYEYVEFGGKPRLKSEKVENQCGANIIESIKQLAQCEYLVATNSGFMNMAAAMDIKTIIVANWPPVEEFYLPFLIHSPIGDLDWMYPQNVHLHQDGENELVKLFSKENLSKAINGEVYPFWSDEYFDLLPESDEKRGFKNEYR